MSNKQQASKKTGGTIRKVIEKLSKLNVREYTTTLFDSKGKRIDDGLSEEEEKSYFETFIDPKQAQELERRLKQVEDEEYISGSVDFQPMDGEEEK